MSVLHAARLLARHLGNNVQQKCLTFCDILTPCLSTHSHVHNHFWVSRGTVPTKLMTCSGCGQRQYCSAACQKRHWKVSSLIFATIKFDRLTMCSWSGVMAGVTSATAHAAYVDCVHCHPHMDAIRGQHRCTSRSASLLSTGASKASRVCRPRETVLICQCRQQARSGGS